jgi:hypothetical protein
VTERKIDGRTKRAADMALAKKQISRGSYEAVLAGTLTLAEARKIERERAPDAPSSRGGSGAATEHARRGRERPQEGTGVPPQPTSRMSKDDTTQACWCGCGSWASPGKHWRPGHDQRAKGIIKRAVTAGKADELSDRLRDYGQERGLI